MSFTITHKPLFSVDLMHHFLLDQGLVSYEGLSSETQQNTLRSYDITTLLDIQPTQSTIKSLRDFRMLFKQNKHGFKVLISMDNGLEGIPLIVPDSDLQLNFILVSKNPSFFAYTNIPFNPSKILSYRNYHQPTGNYPMLTDIPDEFDATLALDLASDGNPETFAYAQGEMVVDNKADPKNLFQAKRATNEPTSHEDWESVYPAPGYIDGTHYNSGDVIWFSEGGTEKIYEAIEENINELPTNIASWKLHGNLPILYSTSLDMLNLRYRQLEYTFTNYDEELKITISNIIGNLVYQGTFIPKETSPTMVISGDNLQEGWLKISFKKSADDTMVLEDEIIFMLSQLSGNLVGHFQINVSAQQLPYRLLDEDKKLRSPSFLVRMKNRKTNWKYYDSIGSELLETEPNPLVFNGYIKIQLDGKDVPNPGFGHIRPTIQKTFSDVYLNS